jgi:hypothetical protein
MLCCFGVESENNSSFYEKDSSEQSVAFPSVPFEDTNNQQQRQQQQIGAEYVDDALQLAQNDPKPYYQQPSPKRASKPNRSYQAKQYKGVQVPIGSYDVAPNESSKFIVMISVV